MPRHFEFEVELLEIQPRIWRRFQLAAGKYYERRLKNVALGRFRRSVE